MLPCNWVTNTISLTSHLNWSTWFLTGIYDPTLWNSVLDKSNPQEVFNPSSVVRTPTLDEVRGQSQTDTRKFIETVKFKHKNRKLLKGEKTIFIKFHINWGLWIVSIICMKSAWNPNYQQTATDHHHQLSSQQRPGVGYQWSECWV